MATYKIDVAHSNINFKVKHMMISTVSGAFTDFDATVITEGDDFSNASIEFSTKVDSISTKNEQRDAHLKSADFFDAESHPEITFKSTSFKKTDDDEFELIGDLTIRGITKSVQLEVEYEGTAVDPYGQVKVGFEIEGKISRKEFGLQWNAVTEAGSIVVSDDVKLALDIQLIQQG